MACIYQPDGRCKAMCTVQRLATLRELFDSAKITGKHDSLSPPAGSFEEEMIDLFQRYKHGHKDSQYSDPLEARDLWSLPAELAKALAQHLPETQQKERFSSPLEVRHSSITYWARFARDRVFAAENEAFACKWGGFSHAFPNHDEPAKAKATKWAIWSAVQAQGDSLPTATLLCLPRGKGACTHAAWRKAVDSAPSICTHIGTILHPTAHMQRERGWQHGEDEPAPPKTGLDVLLVMNAAARQEIGAARLQALAAAFRAACSLRHPQPLHAVLPVTPHAPLKFCRKPLERCEPRTAQLPADLRGYAATPLLHDWRAIAYTDGSRTEVTTADGGTIVRCGAGLWVPNPKPGRASGEQQFTIDPAGKGATNTINRAELAGIWGALQKGQHTIATDSASSICQIRKALLQPMALKHHKHADLLEDIIRMVRASPHHIRLLKVKGHNGIIGNGRADSVAKKAGAMQAGHDIRVEAGREPSYTKGFWLYHAPPAEETEEAAEEEAASRATKRPRAIDDMHTSLKGHMHKQQKLGTANKDSIYYKAWKATANIAERAHSNRFMRDAGITHTERRTALLARTGTLWNQKTAYRFKMASNSTCPLCKQEDSIGHISSGCQHRTMEKMYTERHNQAGRIILKAISKGSKGRALVMADLGTSEKCEADGAPALHLNHVPLHLLPYPSNCTEQEKKEHRAGLRKLRPDIMLVTGDTAATRHITIVELKFCSDTRHEAQLQHCKEQHETLVNRLAAEGHDRRRINIFPILVGAYGTIFLLHTIEALKTLGVAHKQAQKCAKKLHLEAIRYLHKIVSTRRHLEHGSHSPNIRTAPNNYHPPRPP
jgi:ribonuclease HI